MLVVWCGFVLVWFGVALEHHEQEACRNAAGNKNNLPSLSTQYALLCGGVVIVIIARRRRQKSAARFRLKKSAYLLLLPFAECGVQFYNNEMLLLFI